MTMSKAAKVSSSFVLIAIAVLLSVESRVSAMPGPQAANSSQFEKLLTDRNIWGEDAFRVFASLDRWKGEPSILLFTDRVVGGSKFETPEQAREKAAAMARTMAPPFSKLPPKFPPSYNEPPPGN